MAPVAGELFLWPVLHLDERQLTSSWLEHVLFHDLRGRLHATEYCNATINTFLDMQLPVGCFHSYLKRKGIILIWLETKIKLLEFHIDVLAQRFRDICHSSPLKNFFVRSQMFSKVEKVQSYWSFEVIAIRFTGLTNYAKISEYRRGGLIV